MSEYCVSRVGGFQKTIAREQILATGKWGRSPIYLFLLAALSLVAKMRLAKIGK
jgi:hypothetical protein